MASGSDRESMVAGTEMGEELRLRLADELAAFGPLYMKWVKSRLGAGSISYPRMRLLSALHCGGPQIMSGLSEGLGVTPRNITALVDALEEEGLVRRQPHPTDRRATVIELTSKGAHTCGGMYDEHRAAVSELFTELSEEEQYGLLNVLGSLQDALRRKGIS